MADEQNVISKLKLGEVTYNIRDKSKSTVSVSAEGTTTDEVQYITVDGVEKKLAGGVPEAYLKSASSSGNTLTLTNKDNSTTVFAPRVEKQVLLSNLSNINNITVVTDSTKGVAPYNTSYGYTNITVDTSKVSLTESDLVNGLIIGIQLDATVASSYRNVRIRFGESGTYIPLFLSSSIMSGYAYLTGKAYRQFVYSTGVYSTGAFHVIVDSNTTYSNASLGQGFAECATAAATTAKTATISSYSLIVGGTIVIKFDEAVPASATLNITSKGAKPIYYKGAAITADIIKAGDIATFMYNGTQYELLAINTDIDIRTDLDTPVDLSSYSKGDVIPDAIVTKLKQHAVHIKVLYSNRYYHLASFINETAIEGIVFIALDASGTADAVQSLVIAKYSSSENYKLADVGSVDVAAYNSSGLLTIKLDSSGKFRAQSTDSVNINLTKNSSQSNDITVTFPATSGTLATLDDATVTSSKVINALGYTPYNSTNPAGYITGITGTDVTTALGYTPYNSTNPAGYISGITKQNVISALEYTPYDASNPSGYISDYTVTSTDVTSALGYTPYNSSNPAGYISEITSGNVTTALGYTPYNSTNPNGYITGISSSDVTTALGYTPYSNENPDNYVNANTTALNNYYTKTTVDGMIGNRFQAKIVTALPASGISTSTIYMIADSTVSDSYDEYMYIENAWVKIGSTSIDMSDYAKTEDLHNVALTGAYSSLVGRPTIPTSTSDLTNDSGFITNSVSTLANYTKTEDLAAVATSGSYNDLSNKPTIPTNVSDLTNDSGYITNANLSSVNISTFVNNVPYATLSDVQGLEDVDAEEIKRAIAAMEHVGTVTSVIAGTGLTGGGTTAVTLNHANSVTANTGWPSGTSEPENGGQFNVRDVKYDAQGHVTAYQDRAITLPYIAPYDDTTVRGLITTETAARTATDARVTSLENYRAAQFSAFVFCIFGIEQYIDPTTLQPVADRYYQRSDVDTGIFMDSEKIDIHLKAWLKYHYGLDTQERLKNVTCYVYAMGDHGVYVNHMVTYWSQKTNTQISSYPNLLQTGCFIDDGYGSVHRFSTTEVGALLSSSDDGYVAADPLGTGKGYVSGWNTLTSRVTALEDAIGNINDALDEINGEEI